MGSFVVVVGILDDIYCVVNVVLGCVKGGLVYVIIVGCVGFGVVSGLLVVIVVIFGWIVLFEMVKCNYDFVFVFGMVVVGGILGVLVLLLGVIILFVLLIE